MAAYVATSAEAYERSMGRWSARLAEAMLDALALPAGAAVLDAGCGTGALSAAISRRDGAARITGVDLSEAFLASARVRVPAGRFMVGDVTRLDLPDDAFDAALSLLVLQFVSDRAAAVAELARVVKPGGLVAAAMWDFTGGFAFLRAFVDTVAATEPEGEAFRAIRSTDRHAGPAVGAAARCRTARVVNGVVIARFCGFRRLVTWAQGGQGIAGAFVATLPPDRLPRVGHCAAAIAPAQRWAALFVAVARLATGRRQA